MIDPVVKFLGDWLDDVSNIWTILIRLILAVMFGGIIGLERASKRHAAGFRTYILVCLGATLAMITNQFICEKSGQGDYARLGAQVISGIGFLGAGTILVTSKNQIKGLTTAAGLWACACMGLSIGIGYYTLAIGGLVVIIVSLTIFPLIEGYFTERTRSFEIHIEFASRTDLKDFIQFARGNKLKVNSIEPNAAYSSTGISAYTIILEIVKEKGKKLKNHIQIIDEIRSLSFVDYVEELY